MPIHQIGRIVEIRVEYPAWYTSRGYEASRQEARTRVYPVTARTTLDDVEGYVYTLNNPAWATQRQRGNMPVYTLARLGEIQFMEAGILQDLRQYSLRIGPSNRQGA